MHDIFSCPFHTEYSPFNRENRRYVRSYARYVRLCFHQQDNFSIPCASYFAICASKRFVANLYNLSSSLVRVWIASRSVSVRSETLWFGYFPERWWVTLWAAHVSVFEQLHLHFSSLKLSNCLTSCWQTLEDSFSEGRKEYSFPAVSKLHNTYSLESFWRDLSDWIRLTLICTSPTSTIQQIVVTNFADFSQFQ